MAGLFEDVIRELSHRADKETNKGLLFAEYQKYAFNKPLRDEFVRELIHQFIEYKEKADYLYLNNHNDDDGWW